MVEMKKDGTPRRTFMKCAAATTVGVCAGAMNVRVRAEGNEGETQTATVDDVADWTSLPKLPNENELSLRYLRIIERWLGTGMSFYQPWPDRPNCGHFFGGAHWYGLETAWPAEAFACAAISPDYRENVTGVSRAELVRIAISAVRFLCFTHDTGPADCVRPRPPKAHARNSGTKWGERGRGYFPESQCTWSIGPMTRICALLHQHIDKETLGMVARVVEDYALRFDETDPWEGIYGNTMTEENGWTAWGFASAATFLARHDRAEKWRQLVRKWSVCIATTPQDTLNAGSIDGTPLREYCNRHATTLPDFWAENHGMVHPSYTASGILFAANIAAHLRLYGHEVPEEVMWNRYEVYENLKRTVDDYGFMLALQGMDWNYLPGLHGDTPHAFASVFFDDAEAAAMQLRTLRQGEMRLESFDGRFYDPSIADRAEDIQDPLFLRELTINQAAWGYLFHRIYGPGADPLPDDELERRLRRTSVWPHAGAAHNRHPHGQTAFSWRNRIMALPVTREGITLIGPASGSYLGQPVIRDRPASQHLVTCEIVRTERSLAVALVMDRAQRSIRQSVLFASLPDGRTLSYERFDAREDITVERLNQGELAIINETFTAYPKGNCRGVRTLYTPGNQTEFKGWLGSSEADDQRVALGQPTFLNVDDRIGFVFEGSAEAQYLNRHYHKPFHAVHDRLMLNTVPENTACKIGERVATLAALVLPEQPHDAMASEWLKLPESPEGAVALLTRGALAVANFQENDRILSLRWKGRDAFPAFRGATIHVEEDRCRCEMQAPANSPVLLEAVGEVALEGSAMMNVTAEGAILLTNTGDGPIDAAWRKGDTAGQVSVQAGSTVIL